MADHERMRPHLSDEEVAAYLEPDRLTAVERERIERHLVACVACRDEIVALSAVLNSAPDLTRGTPSAGFTRRRIGGIAALLTAAALAGLLLVPGQDRSVSDSTLRNGSATSESVRMLQAVGPVREDVDPAHVEFRWTPLDEKALYRFALLSATGEVIWRTETNEGVVDLPPDVASGLEPGRYYWRSDALLSDLTSATTGEQAFQVRP